MIFKDTSRILEILVRLVLVMFNRNFKTFKNYFHVFFLRKSCQNRFLKTFKTL